MTASDPEPAGTRDPEPAATREVVPLGRPRDPGIDEAILDATRDLLVDGGYARLSFELIARRAGVTRPTIYRRWPSKMHLVHEAVFPDRGPIQFPDTGDLAHDLETLVHHNFAMYARPVALAAVPGLHADLHAHPEVRRRIDERLDVPARAAFARFIRAAVERGQADPAIDPDALFDVMIGALAYRVVSRQDLDAGFAADLTRMLVRAATVGGQGPARS
jgi:AcrR family transcriptional regulator